MAAFVDHETTDCAEREDRAESGITSSHTELQPLLRSIPLIFILLCVCVCLFAIHLMHSLLPLWLFLSKTPGGEAAAVLKYHHNELKMSILVQKNKQPLPFLTRKIHHKVTLETVSEATMARFCRKTSKLGED